MNNYCMENKENAFVRLIFVKGNFMDKHGTDAQFINYS